MSVALQQRSNLSNSYFFQLIKHKLQTMVGHKTARSAPLRYKVK